MGSAARVSKMGIGVVSRDGDIEVRIYDYDARPTLLTHSDLVELGLWLVPAMAGRISMVERQEKQGGWPGQFEVGPALADPCWSPVPGRYFGDVYLAPCRSGLEVHIDSYDAPDQFIGWRSLAGLGIKRLPGRGASYTGNPWRRGR